MGNKAIRCTEECRQGIYQLLLEESRPTQAFHANSFGPISAATEHVVFCHCTKFPTIPRNVKVVTLISCDDPRALESERSIDVVTIIQ